MQKETAHYQIKHYTAQQFTTLMQVHMSATCAIIIFDYNE